MKIDDPNIAVQTVRDVQVRLLKIISGLALVCVPIIWLYEAKVIHQISQVDRFGYPSLLISMAAVFISLYVKPQIYPIAAFCAAITFAMYEVIFLQAVFYGFISDVYSVETFSLWSPLIYLAVFVFLDRRESAIISTLIYSTLLIPNLVRIGFSFASVAGDPTFPILLHMICSHPFYITTLMLVENMGRLLAQKNNEVDAVRALANIDYLTKIPNRRAISQLIQTFLSRAQQGSSMVAVILFDVDNFKSVNDIHGHDVGDQVLVSISEIVKQNLRDQDVCGRWGGEEFIAILIEVNLAEMNQLAERLRIALESFEHPNVGRVTASFGATLSGPDDTCKSLLKRVDTALYQAKAKGRNQVQVI